MKYITEYKMISGTEDAFEFLLNELAKDNWVWCGNFTAIPSAEGIVYSMLMTKSTPKE